MVWIIRACVTVACGCLYVACAMCVVASAQEAWWIVLATSPWWAFGGFLATVLLHTVWTEEL